jgi:hypothetical protein
VARSPKASWTISQSPRANPQAVWYPVRAATTWLCGTANHNFKQREPSSYAVESEIPKVSARPQADVDNQTHELCCVPMLILTGNVTLARVIGCPRKRWIDQKLCQML